MTEDEFENLSEKEQDKLITNSIEWQNAMRNSEVDNIEVFDYHEA